MGVSVETFRRVALEDDDGTWEYYCGRLVRKPPMTMPHNEQAWGLTRQLILQIDPDVYSVRSSAGHISIEGERYLVPGVAVIPAGYLSKFVDRPFDLEEYEEPLPFVCEVWSRSTGEYDVEAKLPAYRQRRDLEVWRVHPYEKTVTAWRRQPDGSYSETVYTAGRVPILGLPGVTIDLERLFRY
jgi:Uma2 family endonuclease